MQNANPLQIRFAVLLGVLIGLPLVAVREVAWQSWPLVEPIAQSPPAPEPQEPPPPIPTEVANQAPQSEPPTEVRAPIRLTTSMVSTDPPPVETRRPARSASLEASASEDDSLLGHHPLSEQSRGRIAAAAAQLEQLGAIHWRLEAWGSQYRCVCQLQPAAQPTEIVEVSSHPAVAVENVVEQAKRYYQTSLSVSR